MAWRPGGVASIRYDKMSYAHPEAFSGRYTVDLEYTASVLEALKTLKENASISSVYCLGHSLGGCIIALLHRTERRRVRGRNHPGGLPAEAVGDCDRPRTGTP